MECRSILYKKEISKESECSFFKDLKLDSLIENILKPYDDKFLEKVYKSPLKNREDIYFRQEIFKDLENKDLFIKVYKFVDAMGVVYKSLEKVQKLEVEEQRNRRILDIIELYSKGIIALKEALDIEVKSEGLNDFKAYIESYIENDEFINLCNEGVAINRELGEIKYVIHAKDFKVTVLNQESFVEEEDYLDSIFRTFINKENDYNYKFQETIEMNKVELRILEKIAILNGDVFSRLKEYCTRNIEFIDSGIESFYREVRFYLSYLDFINRFKKEQFNYPEITCEKHIEGREIFDITLADKMIYTKDDVIKNSFYLKDKERIFLIWGPNSGGKTTFARTFGQLHYLASLGGKCQGTSCKLFLWDEIFTHFEKEESVESLKSKLEDDVCRIKSILDRATPNSIIILNELFSSTALEDGLILGREVLNEIIEKDCLCIFVTFIQELSNLDKTVALVSGADSKDKSKRTFKIERKNIDGEVYGINVAEKYGLDYNAIIRRDLND